MATPLALTCGEPAGIGPDLVLLLAEQHPPPRPITVLSSREVLSQRAQHLGVQALWLDNGQNGVSPWSLHDLPVADKVAPGALNPANAKHVLDLLDAAILGCVDGRFAGMVTGPIHKGVINDAGFVFSGHTEYLAAHTHCPQVLMMLVGGGMRVATLTTHIRLRDVPDAITAEALSAAIEILHKDLRIKFKIAEPRILVAGLNPHAGENGHFGDEEIRIINPVLDRFRAYGWQIEGPLPADTLFQPKILSQTDAVLTLYHDQGLPVLKHASFGHGVNVTLGLPIIRTSVDHGTALNLAGTGQIQTGSLICAIDLAHQLSAQ